jgi:hypothetical protein
MTNQSFTLMLFSSLAKVKERKDLDKIKSAIILMHVRATIETVGVVGPYFFGPAPLFFCSQRLSLM